METNENHQNNEMTIELAKTLNKIKFDLGLNQKELAQKADVTEAVISKILNSKGGVTANTIYKLKSAFPTYNIKWLDDSSEPEAEKTKEFSDYIMVSKDDKIKKLEEELEQKNKIINLLINNNGSTQKGAFTA